MGLSYLRLLLALLVVLAGISLAPFYAPLGVTTDRVLAADAVVSACDDAGFNAALATALAGDGTITFNCGGPATITFSSVKTITAGNTVIIDGGGTITLDGADATRMFDVGAGATLELRNIAVNNGNDGSDTEFEDLGGAIGVLGTLRIFDSSFDSNAGDTEGGAIDNEGGVIEVTGSAFTGNSAYRAGAIDNNWGTLTVTDSTFTSNAADNSDGTGGGIFNAGELTITAATFAGNTASWGGAIENVPGGTLMVADSTFDSNIAANFSGAIDTFSQGTVVTTSTFIGNTARFGGAIGNGWELTVTASTFIGNSAVNNGGAIGNQPGTTTVSTSTFYDNSAKFGGAIYSDDELSVTASTIIGNSADLGGGGIRNSDGIATISSSIVALNTTNGTGPNCGFSGVGTTSLGSNLSDDSSCPFIATGDIENSTAIDLGPLADNGGPTETMVPALTSDAIDAADCSLSTPTDQRGFSRPQGSSCDIGAVEVRQGPSYALCASSYTGAVSSPLAGECGAGTVAIPPFNTSFCINRWTGKLSWFANQVCPPSMWTHMLPDDGDLLSCVSRYTGANRWVSDLGQCLSYEVPNMIPATP